MILARKALIFAPHEDDEINIAGNMILQLLTHNFDVFVCFSTNGDYECPATARLIEAANSLKILGVDEKHIIFLGYGDTFWDFEGTHIFDAYNQPAESNSKHTETYGTALFSDWAYAVHGYHSLYTKESYINDIADVIQSITPHFILCVDYDQHPDHRMLSLGFDEALCTILTNEDNTYQPIVFKKFAYPMAFSAIDDFININLLSTQKPTLTSTRNYLDDLIDISYWQWDNRIRLPVCESAAINTFIIRNTIVKALLKHKTQNIVTQMGRIINSDDIFWQRRTDSLTYQASIEGSSGAYNRVADFKLINTDSILERHVSFKNYLWQPNDEDKEVTFIWEKFKSISRIVIYGNIEKEGRINRILITMNNGFAKIVGPLPERGKPLVIDFVRQTDITSCSLKILETQGDNWGVAECEIFETKEQSTKLWPIVKILVNDTFSNKYYVDRRTKVCKIGVFVFQYNNKISLLVDGSRINKEEDIYLTNIATEVVAISDGGEVLDKAIIIKLTRVQLMIRKVIMSIDRLWIEAYKTKDRVKEWYGFYINHGLKGTMYRIAEKLCLKRGT